MTKCILPSSIGYFSIVNVASVAVAGSYETVLVNLLNVFESVVEVRETEGHTVHVASNCCIVDELNSSAFPS